MSMTKHDTDTTVRPDRGFPKPGAWVARLVNDRDAYPQIAKVRQAYPEHDALDLVMYSASGKKLGRLSPHMGGPKGFEPFCGAQSWVEIEEPPFDAMDAGLRWGWATLLKRVHPVESAQTQQGQQGAEPVEPTEPIEPTAERERSRP